MHRLQEIRCHFLHLILGHPPFFLTAQIEIAAAGEPQICVDLVELFLTPVDIFCRLIFQCNLCHQIILLYGRTIGVCLFHRNQPDCRISIFTLFHKRCRSIFTFSTCNYVIARYDSQLFSNPLQDFLSCGFGHRLIAIMRIQFYLCRRHIFHAITHDLCHHLALPVNPLRNKDLQRNCCPDKYNNI